MTERLAKAPFFVTEQFEENRQEIARRIFDDVDPALRALYRSTPNLSKDDLTSHFMRRDRHFNQADVTGLTDGVAILWTTDSGLAHQSHRIILPDEGQPVYYRDTFNVDYQVVASPPLELQGLEAMSGHNEPIIGLFYAYYFLLSHSLRAA